MATAVVRNVFHQKNWVRVAGTEPPGAVKYTLYAEGDR